MTRRQRPPRPPAPPPGYVWFYWRLMPIEEVERRARCKLPFDGFASGGMSHGKSHGGDRMAFGHYMRRQREGRA